MASWGLTTQEKLWYDCCSDFVNGVLVFISTRGSLEEEEIN